MSLYVTHIHTKCALYCLTQELETQPASLPGHLQAASMLLPCSQDAQPVTPVPQDVTRVAPVQVLPAETRVPQQVPQVAPPVAALIAETRAPQQVPQIATPVPALSAETRVPQQVRKVAPPVQALSAETRVLQQVSQVAPPAQALSAETRVPQQVPQQVASPVQVLSPLSAGEARRLLLPCRFLSQRPVRRSKFQSSRSGYCHR